MRAGSGAECREVGWGLPERATLAGRSARGSGTGPGLHILAFPNVDLGNNQPVSSAFICLLPTSDPFNPLFQNLREQAAWGSKWELGLEERCEGNLQGPTEATCKVPGPGRVRTSTCQPPAVCQAPEHQRQARSSSLGLTLFLAFLEHYCGGQV